MHSSAAFQLGDLPRKPSHSFGALGFHWTPKALSAQPRIARGYAELREDVRSRQEFFALTGAKT